MVRIMPFSQLQETYLHSLAGVIGIGHRVDSHGSWLSMWCVLWVMHRVVCVEDAVGCVRG